MLLDRRDDRSSRGCLHLESFVDVSQAFLAFLAFFNRYIVSVCNVGIVDRLSVTFREDNSEKNESLVE